MYSIESRNQTPVITVPVYRPLASLKCRLNHGNAFRYKFKSVKVELDLPGSFGLATGNN